MATPLELSVLGPLRVTRDGEAVELGTPKQRVLVAVLALHLGRPVSVDTIIDQLWGAAPPPGVTGTLQAYVSGLRRALEPDRERRAPATVLVTVAPGYALRLPVEAVDAGRFEQVVTAEHRRLGTPLLGASPLSGAELEDAADRLQGALRQWQGRAYAELGDAPAAVAERAHLDELRVVALEDLAAVRLALGAHGTTAAELASLTAEHPLRERLWALRALALTRSGRQADALDVLRQVRVLLAQELGLDPGPELVDLQELVLRHDRSLIWVPPSTSSGPGSQVLPTTDPTTEPAAEALPGAPVVGAVRTAGQTSLPLVGRAAELGRLQDAWNEAVGGRARFAVVTGEPGIGKSRLCAALATHAQQRGGRVLSGRCSQDEGAPPLWPWAIVLEQLGQALPVSDGTEFDFHAWEEVTRLVQDACVGPTLLLLDDLHWADTATLRVLRLLAESVQEVPLLVLCTWREQPPPTGALADVAETLARRHATRVELTGLDTTEVAGLLGVVTDQRPTDEVARALRERTDGNPFFLVEYALLSARDDLSTLLAEERPPTAVKEVLDRRLDRLPQETVAALRAAAVIGRRFELDTLAAVTRSDADELLEVVEPAQAAGLVSEEGVDRFQFSHALVRDTLYAGTTASRRARLHARAADHLGRYDDRVTEVARHWLAAGPAHAAEAWRAAEAAGGVALRLHALQEAVDLYQAARAAAEGDRGATGPDRYRLRYQLALAYREAAMWDELVATVEDAVQVAEEIGEVEEAARAAILTVRGALWQSPVYGEVNQGVVAALRRSLDALPGEDTPLRCRVMLSLAGELYYDATFAERRALVDEALAMARRIDDASLRIDGCLLGYLALWAPATAEERLGLTEQALTLAQKIGDEQAEVIAATLRTASLGELGRVNDMWRAHEDARTLAERVRHPYGLLVLDSFAISWRALQGRFDDCDRLFASIESLASRVSLRHAEDAMRANLLTFALWRGGLEPSDEMVTALEGSDTPLTSTIALLLWRGGREDAARRYLATHDVDLSPTDWFSMLNWGFAGAAAGFVGDADLGAAAYARLAPYVGRTCTAGTGVASGPIDAYLALAAHAVGDADLAGRHADDAERYAEAWELPLFARWWAEQRERHVF